MRTQATQTDVNKARNGAAAAAASHAAALQALQSLNRVNIDVFTVIIHSQKICALEEMQGETFR